MKKLHSQNEIYGVSINQIICGLDVVSIFHNHIYVYIYTYIHTIYNNMLYTHVTNIHTCYTHIHIVIYTYIHTHTHVTTISMQLTNQKKHQTHPIGVLTPPVPRPVRTSVHRARPTGDPSIPSWEIPGENVVGSLWDPMGSYGIIMGLWDFTGFHWMSIGQSCDIHPEDEKIL